MRRVAKIAILCGLVATLFIASFTGRASAQPISTNTPVVRVHTGDTLSGIASRYGRTWQQFAEFNHIADPNLIFTGQIFRIPPKRFQTRVALINIAPTPVVHHSVAYLPVTPTPAPVQTAANYGIWSCIAHYESRGNWSIDTGNGYYGGLQFLESTWLANGGAQFASMPQYTSPSEQITVAQRVLAQAGWSAWPQTSLMCGV